MAREPHTHRLGSVTNRITQLLGWVFALRTARLRPWQSALFVASLLAAAVAVGISWHDINHYPGADLRNRVVGARLMLEGANPYVNPPLRDSPRTLIDPTAQYMGYSTCVEPPTFLLLTAAHVGLPYPMQRRLMFMVDWLSLLACMALLARTVRPMSTRWAFVTGAMLVFACGYFWRLHVERGQKYVLFALALSLFAFLVTHKRGDRISHGVVLGIAAALRPTVGIVILPLLLLGRWRSAGATVIVAGGCALATLPVGGMQIWRDYFDQIDRHQRMVVGLSVPQPNPQLRREDVLIEGYDFTKMLDHKAGNLVIFSLFGYIFRTFPSVNESLSHASLPALGRAIAAALAVVWLVVVWLARSRMPRAPTVAMLGIMLVLLLDYFVPQRWSYADVMFLPAIALALPWLRRRASVWLSALLCAGLLLGSGVFDYAQPVWAPLLRTLLVMPALLGVALGMALDRPRTVRRTPA